MPDNYLGLERTVARSDEDDDVETTTAQKLNAGDYFIVGFCLKHTERAYLCILKLILFSRFY